MGRFLLFTCFTCKSCCGCCYVAGASQKTSGWGA